MNQKRKCSFFNRKIKKKLQLNGRRRLPYEKLQKKKSKKLAIYSFFGFFDLEERSLTILSNFVELILYNKSFNLSSGRLGCHAK